MKIAKFLALGVLCACPISAYTQPSEQMKTMAETGAQLSGGIARIAADICQINQGRSTRTKNMPEELLSRMENSEETGLSAGATSNKPSMIS
ncbi:hypothetical protein FHS21_005682 [Phyllobacterium trifolii]|uniref:Uncharacterized protein n=1 Tax=Phyllobacterium trifolii TaxID=300193 RepID=A0A839UK20_9HYPH|nr:hypothetical protein [Phyllobacterium trifolii]MBB3149230.1 hypothetical protein [Phyllobacterium trifolii]